MNTKRIENLTSTILKKSLFSYLILGLITALAAGLRFFKLGEWSFWIDEIYTVNHAVLHYSTLDLILDNIPPARNWFPTSMILTAQVLNILGINEWSARLVSATIGILSIPILYFPVRKIFGNPIALIALLLLAVSPWHIFWSQNARFYTSLLLFYTLALFAFHFGLERNQMRYFFLFYGMLYFGLSERLFAFFIFPVIAGYLVLQWILRFEKPPGLNYRNLLLSGLPILGGGLVEILSWITNGESRFFADFGWFFLYRNDDPIRLLGNISFNIGIPLMALSVFSGIVLVQKKSHSGLLMLTSALLPTFFLIVANPYIFTKDRYIFLILFSWLILAGYGIVELTRHTNGLYKWLAVGILFALFFDAASDDLLYFKVNHGNRGEWKTAFAIIKDKIQKDDAVVAYWTEFGPFYLDREMIAYEEIDLDNMLLSNNRHWFIIDAETIWANVDVITWLEENAQLIDIRYLRTPDDFYLRIYLFDPKLGNIH